jgi:glucuronoarabinoxylan endo-1,4-beta-xylanase
MQNLLPTISTLLLLTFAGCNPKPQSTDPSPTPDTAKIDGTTTIQIDRSQKYQTIDGFGFFGAQAVWWESDRSKLFSEAWGRQVINDLGMTIWRNEYYPPATPTQGQDADWGKQKPVVEGLAKIAKDHNVPLKFIFSVWSAPASMKVATDVNNEPIPGTPHLPGTKKGGTLDPSKYAAFGNWLADGIQLYKNAGIDVYAISPQNEPLFKQDFNSTFYKPQKWYNEMLKNAMPVVKVRFPNVKVFGSENMLEIETEKDRQWFYGANLMKDPAALANLDIWAVHGYREGVTPTATAKLKNLWEVMKTDYLNPSGKPVWMTETSGYFDDWKRPDGKAGALDLAMDIQSALYYGTASAWVWWQGSSADRIDQYSLMAGTERNKKYYVSKHFYRFIRPGARMVKLTFSPNDQVFASAYEHTGMGAFTIVLINSSAKNLKVDLTGANVPNDFDFYLTTADAGINCRKSEAKVTKDNIVLPPSSVVTLVNGKVVE